jgi:lipopolysaccharide export system ATP-binding protein
MVDGKLFKDGTAEELASDPQVRKVYLGQNFELRRSKVTHQQSDNWPDASESL